MSVPLDPHRVAAPGENHTSHRCPPDTRSHSSQPVMLRSDAGQCFHRVAILWMRCTPCFISPANTLHVTERRRSHQAPTQKGILAGQLGLAFDATWPRRFRLLIARRAKSGASDYRFSNDDSCDFRKSHHVDLSTGQCPNRDRIMQCDLREYLWRV